MFDLLIGTGLFTSLCFLIPTRMDGDEIFTFYLCVFTIITGFFFDRKRTVNLKSLGLVLGYLMITVLFNVDFKPTKLSFLNAFVGLLAMHTIAERSELNFKSIGYSVYLFALGCCVFIILQHFGLDPIYQPAYGEHAGMALIPWMMGCIAVMSIPFLCAIHPATCLLLIPMLYFSRSTSCVVAGALVFIFLKLSRQLFWELLAFTLFGMACWFLVTQDTLDPYRFPAWVNAFKYMDNWWFGTGWGVWAHEAFIKEQEGTWYHWRWAHNEFLQFFFEQGIVGSAIFLFWYFNLYWQKNKKIIACVLGVTMISMFHPVFHFGRLAYLGLVILAYAEALKKPFIK